MYSSLTMRIARWSSYTHILFFKLFSIIGLFYKTLTTVNLCCSLHIYFVLDRKKVLNLKLNSMQYWKNNRGSWETNPIRITRETKPERSQPGTTAYLSYFFGAPRYFILFWCDCEWAHFRGLSCWEFLVSVQKWNRFLHSLCPGALLNSFMNSRISRLLVASLGFSCHLQTVTVWLLFQFIFLLFLFLVCLLQLGLLTLCWIKVVSGHPCLVPDLRRNAFSFSLLRMILAVGLLYTAFMLKYVPSMPTFSRVLIINGY